MPRTTATHTPSAPGGRLRAARKAAGLTQADLAGRLGVTLAVVSQVETGRWTPSLNWLVGAAKALGCDPASLHPDLASNAVNRRPSPATPSRPS